MEDQKKEQQREIEIEKLEHEKLRLEVEDCIEVENEKI